MQWDRLLESSAVSCKVDHGHRNTVKARFNLIQVRVDSDVAAVSNYYRSVSYSRINLSSPFFSFSFLFFSSQTSNLNLIYRSNVVYELKVNIGTNYNSPNNLHLHLIVVLTSRTTIKCRSAWRSECLARSLKSSYRSWVK